MKVTAERVPEAQLVLEVEIDDGQVQKSLDQASRRLAQRFDIPGFRKGKAPRAIVERTLGAEFVFDEAIERLIPQVYEEAVQEQGVEPLGPPNLEILERQPVRFKATVPLRPEVDLGDYRSIAVDKEPVEVTDALIADAILEIRRRHAVLEPVERPVEYNDRLRLDIRAEVDGESALQEEGVELSLREGMTIGVPGVDEQLVGLETGPEREFEVDVPEDWDDADVAGKRLRFFVTIHDIKREILPEPDDDLAAEAGDLESFDALRDQVIHDLRSTAERRARDGFHQALLDAVTAQANVEFPPTLLEQEIDQMLRELAQQSGAGADAEAYIRQQGQDVAALRESLRPQASARVLRGLILAEIARHEEIEVAEAAIDAEIASVAGAGPQAEQVRALFDSESGRNVLRRNLLTGATLDRLGEIAVENAVGARGDAVPAVDTASGDESAGEAADGDAAEDPSESASDKTGGGRRQA